MNVIVYMLLVTFGVAFCLVTSADSIEGRRSELNPDVGTWANVSMPSAEDEKELLNWKYSVNNSEVYWSLSIVDGDVLATVEDSKSVDHAWECPEFNGPQKYDEDLITFGNDAGWPSGYARHTKFYRVNDGWIVGFYNRFEGEVWWCSDDDVNPYRISDTKLVNLVRDKDGSALYFLDDTFNADGGLSGYVHFVRRNEAGKWYLKEVVSFPSGLELGAQFGDLIFLISEMSDLYVLNQNLSVETKLSREDWYISRPKEIVMKDKKLYIGAQRYVVSVDTSNWSVKYLVPSVGYLEEEGVIGDKK